MESYYLRSANMSEEKCSLTGGEEKGEELARSLAWQHLVKQAEEDDDDDEEALKKEEAL